jgi:uncharacterized protein with HEPN domain
MSRHEDTVRLRHMLDHALEAVDLARGRSRSDLDTDRTLNLALVRLLEIIGEAARHVTPAGQAALADVPWPQIVGLRNRLIHAYDAVDFDILWDIIELDLPTLIGALRRALDGGAR